MVKEKIGGKHMNSPHQRVPQEIVLLAQKEKVGDESMGSALKRVLVETAKGNKDMQKKVLEALK